MTRNKDPVADTRGVYRASDLTGPNGGVRHQSIPNLPPHQAEQYKNDNWGVSSNGQNQQLQSGQGPLRSNLTSTASYSSREGSRPLGDEYTDIKEMIDSAISASAGSAGPSVTAGTGLTLNGSALDVNATLGHVTSVGTLTGLTVDGAATFNDPVTFTDAVTVPAFTASGAVHVTGASTFADCNVTGFLKVAKSVITPMQYFAAAEGDTITATASSPGVVINPAAALAALTIVFPASPANGQHFSVHSSQDVAAVTVTAAFANGNAPTAGITAGVPWKYMWNSDAAAWFNA